MDAKKRYKKMSLESKDKMAWSRGKTILSNPKIKGVPKEFIFCKNSKSSPAHVRKLLIKENLIPYVCICGNVGTWNGVSLTLQMDHINGDRTDNRLKNLRFLCPNCHSQTHTFNGKNKNTGKIKVSDDVLLKSLEENKNIRRALMKVGLRVGGGNYERCRQLLIRS